MLRRGIAITALAACAACLRTSPPIRSPAPGAAGQVPEGTLAVSGAGTIYGTGGPVLALGVTDWLALEGGAEACAHQGYRWAVGFAGARFTANGRERTREGLGWGPAGDVALAIGLGGNCSGCEGSYTSAGGGPIDALAGGGAIDVGFAIHAPSVVAGTLRASVQLSDSERSPRSLWWYAATGGELYGDAVSFYHAVGIAGVTTDLDARVGHYLVLGAVLRFPVFAPPRRRAAWR